MSDGFEELELLDTKLTLDHAGAATFIIAPKTDRVIGSRAGRGQKEIRVDIALKSAKPQDFHALFLPGGSANAVSLAADDHAIRFVNTFLELGKPIGTMAEGLKLLQSEHLRGRTITSGPVSGEDLKNAGANPLDKSVVCDGNLITARSLNDVEEFNREFTRVLGEVREHSSEIRRTA